MRRKIIEDEILKTNLISILSNIVNSDSVFLQKLEIAFLVKERLG